MSARLTFHRPPAYGVVMVIGNASEDLDQGLKVAREQLDPYLAALVTLHYDLNCKVAVIAKIFRRTRPVILMSLMRARRELKRLMSTPGGTQ